MLTDTAASLVEVARVTDMRHAAFVVGCSLNCIQRVCRPRLTNLHVVTTSSSCFVSPLPVSALCALAGGPPAHVRTRSRKSQLPDCAHEAALRRQWRV